MEIDKEKCVGCGNCHPVCTMGVIYLDTDGKSVVNQEECVECSTCYRVLRNEGSLPSFLRAIRKVLAAFRLGYVAEVDVCPTGALTPPKLQWPRSLRAMFSDPSTVHPGTGVLGRGTDEIKSNDVTGRLREGEAGFVVELGRPGIGARFRDNEKVAVALARLQPHFERENPVTQLMEDVGTAFGPEGHARRQPQPDPGDQALGKVERVVAAAGDAEEQVHRAVRRRAFDAGNPRELLDEGIARGL